jgi:hypothetical protein
MFFVSVASAVGLTILAIRSMAHAFSASFGPAPQDSNLHLYRPAAREHDGSRLGPAETWMLVLEIIFSLGITLIILGLAIAAAMPPHLLVGALLAQVAVIGALVAPSSSVNFAGIVMRPAAIALGVAQLAHVAFFIRAAQALIG